MNAIGRILTPVHWCPFAVDSLALFLGWTYQRSSRPADSSRQIALPR
jgi:hypothetical protein